MSNAKGGNSPGAPNKQVGDYVRLQDLTPGWYTIGTRNPDGGLLPRQVMTFAGLDWPFECADENPRASGDTLTYDQVRRGKRIYLTEAEIAEINAAVGKKVVRWRNVKTGTSTIIRKDSRGYKPLKGDKPQEHYLYVRVDVEPTARDESVPEPEGAVSLV